MTPTTLLLDIEGTVAPVEFVYGTLFPFAREHLESFLLAHQDDPDLQADLAQLHQEYKLEQAVDLPDWTTDRRASAIAYLRYLMARDRKSTGLKSIQGKIWNQGYQSGALKSQLFPEVSAAFERWTQAGIGLYIYSSGSVQAQQLIFQYSAQGNLTPYIQGYFDTRVGGKKEAASYRAIATELGRSPGEILFVSDVEAELAAAQQSQMQTLLSIRPGNQEILVPRFRCIRSLDQVL